MRYWSLTGLTKYEDARLLQLKLVELRALDVIEDTVLMLEHEPVVTQGRGLQFTGTPKPKHMPLPVLPPGIEFAESERGGDLTYHGPGQLVIYPIVKMDGKGFAPKHDVTGFLRKFEKVLIDELATLGLRAESKKDAAGVWVGPENSQSKIASIGIAVRKAVVYHGLAINITNDLKPFHLFSPCGYSPEVMTRLCDLSSEFSGKDWRAKFEKRWMKRMGEGTYTELTCSAAFAETMKQDPGILLAGG
jgi:lipoyl(octanoyl) transferase